MISKYELESRIRNSNKLCNYFCNIFTMIMVLKKIGVICDINTIAYMINKEWFETMKISYPRIKEDTSFKLTKFRYKIKFVQNLDCTKIYDDLFSKIMKWGIYENKILWW